MPCDTTIGSASRNSSTSVRRFRFRCSDSTLICSGCLKNREVYAFRIVRERPAGLTCGLIRSQLCSVTVTAATNSRAFVCCMSRRPVKESAKCFLHSPGQRCSLRQQKALPDCIPAAKSWSSIPSSSATHDAGHKRHCNERSCACRACRRC